MIGAETDQESAVAQQNKLIEESTVAGRVNNVLLLGQVMGVDVRNPVDVQKVLRHLAVVERAVRSDFND